MIHLLFFFLFFLATLSDPDVTQTVVLETSASQDYSDCEWYMYEKLGLFLLKTMNQWSLKKMSPLCWCCHPETSTRTTRRLWCNFTDASCYNTPSAAISKEQYSTTASATSVTLKDSRHKLEILKKKERKKKKKKVRNSTDNWNSEVIHFKIHICNFVSFVGNECNTFNLIERQKIGIETEIGSIRWNT